MVAPPMVRVLITALAVVLLLPATASAKSCDIRGKERKLGATYVTSLAAVRVSCPRAERLVKAFHRCRRDAGGVKGRCKRRVSGFRCRERRSSTIRTQYSARVRCKRGKRRVVHRYTQFT
jgi:hypothetical protein